MAEPLKYMYSVAFFERLCPFLKNSIPDFDCHQFIVTVFNNQWPDLELKERVRHISRQLHLQMPDDFANCCVILVGLSKKLSAAGFENSFTMMFIPDYVENYGVDYPDESLAAMKEVTQLVSCEFAIRPFISRYPEKALKFLTDCSKHRNQNVRRLASEGCRPRLPWGMGIPLLKKSPLLFLPILENLKKDPSEFVRRSVANNINDIGKDHPQIVLDLLRKWGRQHEHTDWILKHGCRSLLKNGNVQALSALGFRSDSAAKVASLMLSRNDINIGETLEFEFDFIHTEKKLSRFRLDYVIDFLTMTGKRSKKVFKITENSFEPGKTHRIRRKQSFRNLTTRKHFSGKHNLSIIANGKKLAEAEFILR